jgi:hypothetical protein
MLIEVALREYQGTRDDKKNNINMHKFDNFSACSDKLPPEHSE